ncbi:uncharacterized protein LOC116188488 isoform X2 [Punica granatum]|nr:uncharacterized protein LOC116188488 isoform X2 [Punica granatum]XP_031373744.1 uncharacterized protein LOC116188488 isoform X2 [Punica granatum]XP_031373745.1 uncharacterized protein LOC116188488 isoform X2 [Punica granatum]XP_031373746.1 uncharacterized protein LOC116188488 isoform X2 [Punica granatum]XP_031373747.1 uncharacterized protein LOC116188488 isoform X2 [Punica granatum]
MKDLWDCYREWSAFGACTKVVFPSGETVKKYYIPYLSAIQIYTNKPVSLNRVKSEGSSNSAAEFESDSWSDDSGSDKLSRSLSDNSSKTWDNISEDSSLDQAVSWPVREKFGHIYLEYFESCCPSWRVPMMDKINELAKDHPALMTLRSMDVSPASWMAVAWYPIYHIPNIGNKDLSTCFLTYHTLSSSFLDNGEELDEKETLKDTCCKERAHDKISLSPFGLATYKMQGDLWVNPEMTPEYLKFMHLQNAAHSWLKQLNAYHHDLSFFTHHSAL